MSQFESEFNSLKLQKLEQLAEALVPKMVVVRLTQYNFCHFEDSFLIALKLRGGRGSKRQVTELRDLENPELKRIFRKQLLRGLVFLTVLVGLIFLLALSFEPEIKATATWLTENFGFWGIGVCVFVADLLISPIPPDAALFFIGKSALHQDWMIWVPLLGLISTGAGVCGWLIGQKLEHLKILHRFIESFKREHKGSVKKFGFWMVVIGALTPLPFSLTCWLAGIFKLPLKTFLIAALVRVPRFVLYYWAIFFSGEMGGLLRDFL